jgi:transcriptional regulator with XRE-family HTH domain
LRAQSEAVVASEDSRDGVSVFAQRVRQLRYTKGWGPDDLAARAKISRTALYQIESGKTGQPRAGTVRRLARAFGVAPEALLDETALVASTLRSRVYSQPGQSSTAKELGHEAGGPMGISVSETPPWLRDLDLERKFRRLLDSPMRDAVARIVEETYRLLPPEPFEGGR